jgi:glutamate-1-semialdehyde 2,1-aminomutase
MPRHAGEGRRIDSPAGPPHFVITFFGNRSLAVQDAEAQGVEHGRGALEMAAKSLLARESAIYEARRPLSRTAWNAGKDKSAGFYAGVPLHWMTDWPMPFPMVLRYAQGARLEDIDGHGLVDLCLGDSAAMFGHAPAPVAAALAARAAGGLSAMLPTQDSDIVGRLLSERFGLPFWQVATTASDANRFALRVARALTGRKVLLVFDGCYHGAVDDTLVDLRDGRTVTRPSLLGQAVDLSATTRSIPFNDIDALEAALAPGDVAVVIAEPVMTNCSMIQPQPGFHAALRRLTRAAGTLLLIDETHTLSSGLGGYCAVHGLEPDIFVAGKAVAGGVPAAVWGFTADIAARLDTVRAASPGGHSGIGTTLSGSALQLACLRACLEEVMTHDAYGRMTAGAERIAAGLEASIREIGLPWHVTRVGARLEIVLRRQPLRNAVDARAAASHAIEAALHLALLNRGYLVTPFHNMVLVSPCLSPEQADGFVEAFADAAASLAAEAGSI